MPKLFTAFAREELVENKSFKLRCAIPLLSRSLIEQSKRSGLKNVAESATEDNPGRPGKGWRQLVSPSPPIGESQVRGIYHQFLWPESCPVSPHTN